MLCSKLFYTIIYQKIILYILIPSGSPQQNSYVSSNKKCVDGLKIPDSVNAGNDTQKDITFLILCSKLIPSRKTGKPQDLLSFINSIKILEKIAGKDHEEILRLFIIAQLSGTAYDVTFESNDTLEGIKDALLRSIKYDHSLYVESKIIMQRKFNATRFQ